MNIRVTTLIILLHCVFLFFSPVLSNKAADGKGYYYIDEEDDFLNYGDLEEEVSNRIAIKKILNQTENHLNFFDRRLMNSRVIKGFCREISNWFVNNSIYDICWELTRSGTALKKVVLKPHSIFCTLDLANRYICKKTYNKITQKHSEFLNNIAWVELGRALAFLEKWGVFAVFLL